MTDSCQLEGRTLKWQLAYFGPKVGYFGHIFQDIDFICKNLAEMGSKVFRGLNQKSGCIRISGI